MTTSYKTLWQEADAEINRLKAEIQQLKTLNAGLSAAFTSSRAELASTPAIVDLAGIARHMKVERFTPQQWRQRELLPEVDFPEIAEPLWLVSTVKEKFVIPTRRIWYDTPNVELSPAA